MLSQLLVDGNKPNPGAGMWIFINVMVIIIGYILNVEGKEIPVQWGTSFRLRFSTNHDRRHLIYFTGLFHKM